MTNQDLYKLALTVLRKESRGNIVKPDRFTYLLKQCHHEYYNQQIAKWDATQTVHDSLKPFLVTHEALTFAAGSHTYSTAGTPPTAPSKTYRRMVSAYAGTTLAEFDIVTPQEWGERIGDSLTVPTAADPVLLVGPTTFKILPATITTVHVSYLKTADYEPFFDYYIDANRNIQGMSTTYGAAYVLTASQVYRDGTTSGTVNSINRELEWGDHDKVNIFSMLLEKLGVSLSGEIAQYAMAKEQQQNTV